MPFRAAHHVVSRLVKESASSSEEITAARVTAVATEEAGREIDVDDAFVSRSLDPWEMVHARALAGGPAPSATREAAERSWALLAADRLAAQSRRDGLDAAILKRRRLADGVISG